MSPHQKVSAKLEEFKLEYAQPIKDDERLHALRDLLFEIALQEIYDTTPDSYAASMAEMALETKDYPFKEWAA